MIFGRSNLDGSCTGKGRLPVPFSARVIAVRHVVLREATEEEAVTVAAVVRGATLAVDDSHLAEFGILVGADHGAQRLGRGTTLGQQIEDLRPDAGIGDILG